MLSGVMLLRHVGEGDAAARLEAAIAAVTREGRTLTYDLEAAARRSRGRGAHVRGRPSAVIAQLSR